MLSQRDWKRLGIPLPYQPQDLLEGSSVLEALSSQCSTDAPSPTPCGFALGLSGKIESNPCWTLEGQTPRGVGGPHLQVTALLLFPTPRSCSLGGVSMPCSASSRPKIPAGLWAWAQPLSASGQPRLPSISWEGSLLRTPMLADAWLSVTRSTPDALRTRRCLGPTVEGKHGLPTACDGSPGRGGHGTVPKVTGRSPGRTGTITWAHTRVLAKLTHWWVCTVFTHVCACPPSRRTHTWMWPKRDPDLNK